MISEKYSIMLVDDHPSITLALQAVLAGSAFVVKACVDNGPEAIAMIRDHRPDYVILDIGLPGLDGLTVMQCLGMMQVKTNFLIYSCYGTNADIVECCVRAGARGVVDKTQPINDVLTALNTLKKGGNYFPAQMLSSFAGSWEEIVKALTLRERVIFKALIASKTSKQIAEALSLSEKTIRTYRARLLKKFNIRTVLELMRISSCINVDSLTYEAECGLDKNTKQPQD